MNDYKVRKDFNIEIPKSVKMIITILEKNGYEAFAVGGCIRDTILGRQPQDWDITTSALPQQVKALFNKTLDTGIQHGTVTVMMSRVGYEVTTYPVSYTHLGVGKSTVGVVLAKVLGYSFIDSDLVIQEKTGRLLKDIIAEEGTEKFKEIENDVNKSLNTTKAIIATGGSAVYGQEAMEHFAKIGTIVYLELELNELSKRLGSLKKRGVVLKLSLIHILPLPNQTFL